ncbi:MAG: hypothetical protein ACI976_002308 [Aureispira sp.]
MNFFPLKKKLDNMHYLSFLLISLTGVCFFCQSNFILAQSRTEVLKMETCWSYNIENNVPATSGSVSRQIEYNDQGKKTKETSYKKNGVIAYEYFFQYSLNTRETYWKLLDRTKVKSETEIYNQGGQLLERIRYGTDGKIRDKITVVYENGEKKEETYFNKLNEITYRINYSYNKEQQTIRESYTSYKGEAKTNGAIDLDSNGLTKSYEEYELSGPLIRSIKYERDEEGRILVKSIFAADKTLELKEVYEYTENERHYSVYINGGTELIEHVIYKYNYYQNK